MSDERQLAREMSSSELRAIVAGGLHGKSRAEIAHFAKELGITLAELRDLVAPPVPSAEQVAQLAERITTASDEPWLLQLRDRVWQWGKNAGEADDAEAERRVSDLLKAIEHRLAALRPPPPPQRCLSPTEPAQWTSPADEPPIRPASSNVVDPPRRRERPAPSGDGGPAPRMPVGDGFDWMRR